MVGREVQRSPRRPETRLQRAVPLIPIQVYESTFRYGDNSLKADRITIAVTAASGLLSGAIQLSNSSSKTRSNQQKGAAMCLAIPGKVIETFGRGGLHMARVQFGGIVRESCLEYVPETEVGEYVLVHVGFAISRVDEEEAKRTYQVLADLDQLTELDAPVIRDDGSLWPEKRTRA
jgi:hydrogenase expression/formation protein HypC